MIRLGGDTAPRRCKTCQLQWILSKGVSVRNGRQQLHVEPEKRFVRAGSRGGGGTGRVVVVQS
jgi:hypothetical protein